MKIRSFLFVSALMFVISAGVINERQRERVSTLSASGTCDHCDVGESTHLLRMDVSAPRLRRSVTG